MAPTCLIDYRWHNICKEATMKHTSIMKNQYSLKKTATLISILALPALAFADQMGAIKTGLQILGFLLMLGLISAIAAIYFYRNKKKWAFIFSILIVGLIGLIFLLIFSAI